MKNYPRQFAITCLLIMFSLIALHYFTFESITEKKTVLFHLIMYPILAAMYIFSFNRVVKAMDNSPRQFVNTFMLATMGRMFGSLLLLIPFLMLNKEYGKSIGVFFIVSYFVFLVAEVPLLYKISKHKG